MLKTHKILIGSAILALANLAQAQSVDSPSSTSNLDAPQTGNAIVPSPEANGTLNPPPMGITGPAAAPTANADTPVTPVSGSTTTAKTSDDPYIQRRIDKKEAKDEYKAKKKIAKNDYKAEKKEANANLKAAQKSGETGVNDPSYIGK